MLRTTSQQGAHVSQASAQASHTDDQEAPHHFLCSITQEIMEDPVMCADGHSYEKSAIAKWFGEGHDTSPMTGIKIPTTLFPNINLRHAIQEFHANRPAPTPAAPVPVSNDVLETHTTSAPSSPRALTASALQEPAAQPAPISRPLPTSSNERPSAPPLPTEFWDTVAPEASSNQHDTANERVAYPTIYVGELAIDSSATLAGAIQSAQVGIGQTATSPSRHGTVALPSGETHEGELAEVRENGHGSAVGLDGSRYTGDWLDGVRHGEGTEVYADGSSYEGGWVGGKKEGFGTESCADGSTLRGTWSKGQKDGRFIRTSAQGSTSTKWFDKGVKLSTFRAMENCFVLGGHAYWHFWSPKR